MSNHFHLVVAGDRPDAVSLFMMNVNGQYSAYRHAAQKLRGHLWQGRFFSCVLDDDHWATALRDVPGRPPASSTAKLRCALAPRQRNVSAAALMRYCP